MLLPSIRRADTAIRDEKLVYVDYRDLDPDAAPWTGAERSSICVLRARPSAFQCSVLYAEAMSIGEPVTALGWKFRSAAQPPFADLLQLDGDLFYNVHLRTRRIRHAAWAPSRLD